MERSATACQNCQRRGDMCQIQSEEDSRRRISYTVAHELRARIHELETENARLKRDRTASSGEASASPHSENAFDGAGEQKPTFEVLDRLKLFGAGAEICHFGPTSPFAYLPDLQMMQSNIVMVNPSEPTMLDPTRWKACLPYSFNISWFEHQQLTEAFTRYFASWVYAIDMNLFLQDMHRIGGITRSDYYSPLLHNAILAMACRFVPNPDRPADAAHLFRQQAISYYHEELENPVTATVNGLMLLASLHTEQSQTNSGAAYFAAAVQTSVTLGLNVNPAYLVRYGMISTERQRQRNNTFWSVFCQDRLWALAVGRQPILGAFNVPMPDRQEILHQPNLLTGAQDQTIVSLCFAETCKLSHLAGMIMEQIYGLNGPAELSKTCNNIYRQIDAWRRDLPRQLLPLRQPSVPTQVHTLSITADLLSILSLRPLYHNILDLIAEDEAIRSCDRHAAQINDSMKYWQETYGIRNCPLILGHAAFGAATVHLLASVTPRDPSNEVIYDPKTRCEESISILKSMGIPRAAQMGDILQSLSREWWVGDFTLSSERDLDELLQALYTANPIVL
ncbi:uncharacterized protein I303_106334 [Kwoniella dejecticola CBS 10117]|uniref:Xylanolytic transcriptional activator regulatory domain-containing protein n=1 Tax=Kwoniella dejecticola CBS 10117 TaxID=1296121 RepID=A0A1A5ZV09_9TREE|nr:uncharacterized protein I303_08409 [Kwoniella dejecticola CBS 10117]OBR81638.1 hypothetical protein I303_08409 [Kwoniella dejecticola CBS 10117]